MRELFISKLKKYFPSNNFTETTLSESLLFVYDDKSTHKSFMVATLPTQNALQINNPSSTTISHICVDGDFIPFGQPTYTGIVSTAEGEGRPDSMLFNDAKLLIIELKMDVLEETSDKGRWNRFSDAMNQIKTFYLYVKNTFHTKKDLLSSYYPDNNIEAIICMNSKPELNKHRNAQRNTQIDKFRVNTGLRLTLSNLHTI